MVLEIEDVGDDQDKAFLIGAVLIRLTEHLRLRQRHQPGGPPGLRHLTVLEEAHRLLRDPGPGQRGPAAKAVELFAALFAEVRAYGEGLVVAEQIPSKLITDVVKNTAVKIVHRLPAADDRQAVGATMNLTPAQDQYIVTLAPGEAAVFADGADYPWLVRMPDGTGRETAPAATAATRPRSSRPRSASCGPDCQASPCTLRQMRQAQRAAEADPRITGWAELAVLAHLTGWTMPFPDDPFAGDLRAMDERRRDCALAPRGRRRGRGPGRGDQRAGQPGPAGRARDRGDAPGAGRRDLAVRPRRNRSTWRRPTGGCWCWRPCRRPAATGTDGRHPRSAEWEHDYGRAIPGQDCAAQLETVTRWHHDDQRDTGRLHAVAWGQRPERRPGTRGRREGRRGRLGRTGGQPALRLHRAVPLAAGLPHAARTGASRTMGELSRPKSGSRARRPASPGQPDRDPGHRASW